MPTGYTAYIEDGNITTGKEFLKLCLREFGIAVDMRDEPLSVPVPAHFEPDEWYKNHYMNTVKKLKENESLTFEEVKLRRQREHDKEVKSARRAIPAPFGEVLEWFKRAVLKTAVQRCTVGSNPTLSANTLHWSCSLFEGSAHYFCSRCEKDQLGAHSVLRTWSVIWDCSTDG